jgi:serine phosphatase RsbU (regulator of sigma subunit)
MSLFDKLLGKGVAAPGTANDEVGALPDVPLDGATVVLRGGIPPPRPGSEDERAHYLVVVEGEQPGLRIRLGPEPILIGRMAPADVVLADTRVSRSHCRVGIVMNEVVVIDLDSTNGTFIDGTRVSRSAPLPTGARLVLGRHVLEHEWRIRKEVEESQELDRDIAKASLYVQSLLPPPLSEGPIRTEWILLPSTRLGGDAFGYRFLDAHTFAIYLLDVSGHGAGAAMHAVSVINVLRQSALPRTDFTNPSQVIENLNAMFQMESHSGMYLTLWYGVYNLDTRTLAFCSAGHHAGFLVPLSRDRALPLNAQNLVLGALPDYRFKSDSVQVPPESTLYVFSDGVFEIITEAGEQWGLNDVVPLILEPALPGVSEPQRLHRAVQTRSRSAALEDDFSMLVVTFK